MDKQLEIFPWDGNFATGIEEIDDQHKRLIELINILVGHLAYQSDAPTLNQVFDALRDYAQVHFEAEERIWKQHFLDDYWAESHTTSHSDFIAKVLELKALETSKPFEEVLEDIVSFLTHWLALHILESDKRMAKVVLALPSGVSLERAKEIANEEMSGATRLLIDTVMGMYDKLAHRTLQMTREINRRERAEQELRHAKDELQRLKEKAEAANLAKSAFLANMSHEIRTPLNAITGMAHLVRRVGVTPQQAERLDKIDTASAHLLEVLNNILDFSKIEAGKFQLEENEFKLGTITDNVISMVHERAQARRLHLEVESDDVSERFLGDPTRIQQALLNYVTNAVKFADGGRIAVRVKTLAEDADGSVLVRYEVQDQGAGIPAATLENLFSPFEQADNSTSRRHGGTGLGLAITRKLAELMGGSAGATSDPGVGSTFWFTARLKRPARLAPASASPGNETPEGRLRRLHAGSRILLAEDEIINREIVTELLAYAGLVVETARDGQEAVELARQGNYALILMDMQMPRMDGLEATRRIRNSLGLGIPIVAMTANAFNEDRLRCLDAGMDDFMAKPIHPDAMFDLVEKWLSVTR